LLVLQDDEPLDHVLQLAHVARPVVFLEELPQLVRDLGNRPVVLARVLGDEEVGEPRDLVPALAQGGHDDLDDLEPVVQILPEIAGEHHLLEIPVGGGQHAHVHRLPLVAAQTGELAVLQHVEQLGLQGRLQLRDFVQEDRAAVGLFELADPRGRRAGERTLLVAEQLALQQLGGQRGAVDADHRVRVPRRALVDRARHQFLPDAAVAADQHGDVAVGHLLDHGGHRAHPLAAAPEQKRPVLVVAQLLAQGRDLRDEARLLGGVLDGHVERDLAQALRVVRLDHVVGRPEPDRLDDDRGLLAPGQHDGLGLGPGDFQRAQRRQAVESRHHHVEQHDIGRIALADGGEHLVAPRIGPGLVAAQREERTQVGRKRGIVVDDGHERLSHCGVSCRGSASAHVPRARLPEPE